jgi:hypothetical protein
VFIICPYHTIKSFHSLKSISDKYRSGSGNYILCYRKYMCVCLGSLDSIRPTPNKIEWCKLCFGDKVFK